jgi:hypothetical protein
MWTDETTFAFVAFFAAVVVEWYVLWYLFGRRKDARSIRRYRVWSAVVFTATVLPFWFFVFGPSWKIGLFLAVMVGSVLWAELISRKACHSCGELLRNPEWPAALSHCYKCGARLDKLPEVAQADHSGTSSAG